MKHNKIKLFICVLTVIFILMSSIMPIYSLGIEGIISNADLEVLNIIYTTAGDGVSYSIVNSKQLKSVSDESSYSYTLYELSPYGYIILTNDNLILMEACYMPDAQLPISASDTEDYYYVGPSTFATKNGNVFVTVDELITLSQNDLNAITAIESRVATYEKIELSCSNTANISGVLATPRIVNKSVQLEYFSRLNDYGNNANGTCTVLALAMLIGYYDCFRNQQYVADQYTYCSPGQISVGTTEAFHQLLCDYVYGNEEQGGVFISEAVSGINEYLDDRGLDSFLTAVNYSVAGVKSRVKISIDMGYPLVASMFEWCGANMNHTVVVYGYQYYITSGLEINHTSSNTPQTYRVHYGHHNGNTNVLLSSDWFADCGYITE